MKTVCTSQLSTLGVRKKKKSPEMLLSKSNISGQTKVLAAFILAASILIMLSYYTEINFKTN
jgi:hypothetical protein